MFLYRLFVYPWRRRDLRESSAASELNRRENRHRRHLQEKKSQRSVRGQNIWISLRLTVTRLRLHVTDVLQQFRRRHLRLPVRVEFPVHTQSRFPDRPLEPGLGRQGTNVVPVLRRDSW